MYFDSGKKVCDNCCKNGHIEPREYSSLVSDKDNLIDWFECGHVYVIKDGIVEQQYDYSK